MHYVHQFQKQCGGIGFDQLTIAAAAVKIFTQQELDERVDLWFVLGMEDEVFVMPAVAGDCIDQKTCHHSLL